MLVFFLWTNIWGIYQDRKDHILDSLHLYLRLKYALSWLWFICVHGIKGIILFLYVSLFMHFSPCLNKTEIIYRDTRRLQALFLNGNDKEHTNEEKTLSGLLIKVYLITTSSNDNNILDWQFCSLVVFIAWEKGTERLLYKYNEKKKVNMSKHMWKGL